jgi:ribosomal protein S27AE
MKDIISFYKKNLERLKSLGEDCPQCIQDRTMCHHYDYLRDYIKELEDLPPFDQEKFEIFWKAYPKKKERKYALKVWEKLKVDDALFDTIMKALEAHKKSFDWTKNKGQFIPNPTTWLNGERWNDEVELPGNVGNSKYDNI